MDTIKDQFHGDQIGAADPPPPVIAMRDPEQKLLWAFYPDGRVEIGPHVTADEAGQQFIDFVMRQWPVAVAERQN